MVVSRMKLLFCLKCTDLFNLDYEMKECSCGSVKGRYIDQQVATYAGESAVPLGFTNNSFVSAIKNQPKEGMGEEFTAFVIPKKCPTFIRRETP